MRTLHRFGAKANGCAGKLAVHAVPVPCGQSVHGDIPDTQVTILRAVDPGPGSGLRQPRPPPPARGCVSLRRFGSPCFCARRQQRLLQGTVAPILFKPQGSPKTKRQLCKGRGAPRRDVTQGPYRTNIRQLRPSEYLAKILKISSNLSLWIGAASIRQSSGNALPGAGGYPPLIPCGSPFQNRRVKAMPT